MLSIIIIITVACMCLTNNPKHYFGALAIGLGLLVIALMMF